MGSLPEHGWCGSARGIGRFLVVAFLLLLFPTGRLPSPRWRLVLWGAIAYIGVFTLVIWLSPVLPDTQLAFVHNPLGLEIEIVNVLVDLLYFTIPLLLVMSAFIARSRLGKAMRATAQDPEAARLMGINVDTTI